MGSSEFPVISLFSGLGGIDQGLESAGYDIRVCVEMNHDRVSTLKVNKPNWNVIHDKIENVPTKTILREGGLDVGEAFMVAGGPPCQPYSKSAFWVKNRIENISRDPRSKMLDEFLRVVKEAKPRTFLFENVCGLSYKTSSDVLQPILRSLRELGYNLTYDVLNAVDYGVPQKRKRFFVIGARNGCKLELPDKTHAPTKAFEDEGLKEWVTAGDAIIHLDNSIVNEDEKIYGKYGHLLGEVPPGGNYLYFTEKRGYPDPKFRWRSRFWTFLLKLSPELPSWTIQANPAMYQGPFHWRNRHLRVKELKALQCISKRWKIEGGENSVKSQIGDACPPPLIEAISKQILKPYMV